MDTNNVENLDSYRALRFNKDGYKEFSNFDKHDFEFMGYTFYSGESAFQACKLIDGDDLTRFHEFARDFINCTPGAAKRLGRKVKLSADWETVKAERMYAVITEKFKQNPALSNLLLSTGERFIIEDNTWHDNTWGLCTCGLCYNRKESKNVLGLLLMRVRADLKGESSCRVKYWLKGDYDCECTGYVDLMDGEDIKQVLFKHNLDGFNEFMKRMV